MSFLRHQEIFPPMGAPASRPNTPAHRLDEFPAGYSLAGCSPAGAASASPAVHILHAVFSPYNEFSSNGDLSVNWLSQPRGPLQSVLFRVGIPNQIIFVCQTDDVDKQ